MNSLPPSVIGIDLTAIRSSFLTWLRESKAEHASWRIGVPYSWKTEHGIDSLSHGPHTLT